MSPLRIIRRTLITALPFAFCMLMVVGCDVNKLDQKHFDQVKVGMSEDDIQKVLGKPVQNDTLKMPGGDTASKEIWKENEKSITVTFINKKATTVEKSGF